MASKRVLKRAVEALIMVVQEQAITIYNIKARINKTQENSKCRMCGKVEESINHVLRDRSERKVVRAKARDNNGK